MNFHIFVKADCPQCPAAKTLGEKLEIGGGSVLYQDLDTAEGMANALKYNVRSLPTILLVDNDKEQSRWIYPELPSEEDALKLV